MAGASGYLYILRMPITAVTAAEYLLQIRPGAAPVDIPRFKLFQTTKTTSELLNWQLIIYSVVPTTFATVTAAVAGTTLNKGNPADPASLQTLSTTGTGYHSTGNPAGGTSYIADEGVWNVINGETPWIEIPEGRRRIPQATCGLLRLNTGPAASMNIGAIMDLIEYQ